MNDNFCRMVADALTEQDAKEERRKLRPWVGAVVSGMCLALLFVATKSAYGQGKEQSADVAQYGQISVYLYNKPCENKLVLGRLEERVHKTYRAGEAFHKSLGHRELCYLRLEAYDSIFILDEHGDMADLPKSDFKPWKGNTKPKPGQVGV
jgi:hypothetical protein